MLKQNKYVLNVQESKWYFMFRINPSFPQSHLLFITICCIFNCVSHIKDCKDHNYLLKTLFLFLLGL